MTLTVFIREPSSSQEVELDETFERRSQIRKFLADTYPFGTHYRVTEQRVIETGVVGIERSRNN